MAMAAAKQKGLLDDSDGQRSSEPSQGDSLERLQEEEEFFGFAS